MNDRTEYTHTAEQRLERAKYILAQLERAQSIHADGQRKLVQSIREEIRNEQR